MLFPSHDRAGVLRLATNAEASAGTDDTIAVSADDLNDVVVPDSSETVRGIVELATVAEVVAGVDTERACTAAGVAAVAIAGSPTASTAQAGISELATDAEAVAGTATDRVLVCSNIDNFLAEPPAIGGTTPGAGSFTTLTTTGAIASTGGQIVLGSDNAANKVDIGLGTTARDINIANSAAAHTVGS